MSRTTYAAPRQARERWPELTTFIGAVCHGDDDVSVESDVDRVIASYDLDRRQRLATEWWDWNGSAGTSDDVRFTIEAMQSGVLFGTATHARRFMNECYDKLITSVRRELGEKWKP